MHIRDILIPGRSAKLPGDYAKQGDAIPPGAVTEYRFHPVRRWRFDYAWVDARLALEVEGGAWTRGRHTRGKGFIGDMTKYNTATIMGWRILRVTPAQVDSGEAWRLVREALGGCDHDPTGTDPA